MLRWTHECLRTVNKTLTHIHRSNHTQRSDETLSYALMFWNISDMSNQKLMFWVHCLGNVQRWFVSCPRWLSIWESWPDTQWQSHDYFDDVNGCLRILHYCCWRIGRSFLLVYRGIVKLGSFALWWAFFPAVILVILIDWRNIFQSNTGKTTTTRNSHDVHQGFEMVWQVCKWHIQIK